MHDVDQPATRTTVAGCAERLRTDMASMLRSMPGVTCHDIDDIVQDAMVELLTDHDDVMNRYQHPAASAHASRMSRTVDHQRRQRAQRGEGARLITVAGDVPAVKRRVVAIDAVQHSSLTAGHDDHVADQMLAAALLGRLHPTDRQLVWLVHGEAHTVTEAARLTYQSRAHASRRLTGAMHGLLDAATQTICETI